MADNPNPEEPVKETVETVTEPVVEAVPAEVEPVVENPSDDIPPWGKELTEKVDSLASAIEGISTPVVAAVESDPVEADETPVPLPWTHRNPFKRD